MVRSAGKTNGERVDKKVVIVFKWTDKPDKFLAYFTRTKLHSYVGWKKTVTALKHAQHVGGSACLINYCC